MNELNLIIIGISIVIAGMHFYAVSLRIALNTIAIDEQRLLREENSKSAERALYLINSHQKQIATLQLLLLFFYALWFGGTALIFSATLRTFPISAILGLAFLSAFLISFLEWFTARVAVKRSVVWLKRCGGVQKTIAWFFTPVTAILLAVAGPEHNGEAATPYVTEDELKSMVYAGIVEGVLEQDERKMIHSIFDLGDTLVREVMTPRIDLVALDVNTPIKQALQTFHESGFSRLPVFSETIDNILGVLYVKDLLPAAIEMENSLDLKKILREGYFVPEAKIVDALLAEMRSKRVHLALVIDEYGGIAGIVTLEDIVEEIFGEIMDEYDIHEEQLHTETESGDHIFHGKYDIDDFNDLMEAGLPSEEADTLGGFIYRRLGHVPVAGESVEIDGFVLTVQQVTSRRIRKVLVQEITEENIDG